MACLHTLIAAPTHAIKEIRTGDRIPWLWHGEEEGVRQLWKIKGYSLPLAQDRLLIAPASFYSLLCIKHCF